MKRREFLKNTSLLTLGTSLLPSLSCSSGPGQIEVVETPEGFKVLIIGAGIAGLYAAYILKQRGIDFEILEASAIHGGRIRKLEGFADFPLDVGGQWLHGKNSIIGNLIDSTGTSIFRDNSDEYFWFDGDIDDAPPRAFRNVAENLEDDPNLTDINYLDYFHRKGIRGYDNLVEALAGELGTSANRVSVLGTARDFEKWSSGETDYKFTATFYDFIDQHIASQVRDKIRYNSPVFSIDYSGSGVVVTDMAGNRYEADKVIVTVPITILKAGDIQFEPALPAEKLSAFSRIGMDAGMKIYMKFNRRFFRDNLAGGIKAPNYVNESYNRNTTQNVLFAFVMGAQAEYLSARGQNAVNHLLDELDDIYHGQASPAFIDSHIQDWGKEPFIRGAYSYSPIGIGNAREIAAQPVADKLFFAGEAMNINGHFQTIHGAAETGKLEAERIVAMV